MIVHHGIQLLLHRMFSVASETVPVVTIPTYLKDRLKHTNSRHVKKRLDEVRYRSQMGNRKVPIITSPQKPELNHYLGRVYDPRRELPLITLGWRNGKYRGHSFTIHKHADHPSILDPSISSFSLLGLNPDIVHLLEKNGFKTPTVIQENSIPEILRGQNVVCCAETGSGKTLAYTAPLLQLVKAGKLSKTRPPMAPLALILVPGKELALQISEVFTKLCAESNLSFCSLVPGINLQDNLKLAQEQQEVDIVVATVGAFSALVKNGVFTVSYIDHVVIDEADTLLDSSFVESVTEIMKGILIQEAGSVTFEKEGEEYPDFASETRQRAGMMGAQLILVGATVPRRLEDTFGSLVDLSSLSWVRTSYLHRLPPHLTHHFLRMGKEEKSWNLVKLVKEQVSKKHPMIIFSHTASSASWVSFYLASHSFPNVCFHKKIGDRKRKENFSAFQEGEVDIICCTDLGSRGLDTSRAKHVLNYDFPRHMSDYIHRSGRTGRVNSASPSGEVSSFISSKHEIMLLQQIETAARRLKPLPNVDANIKLKYEQYALMKQSGKSTPGN